MCEFGKTRWLSRPGDGGEREVQRLFDLDVWGRGGSRKGSVLVRVF